MLNLQDNEFDYSITTQQLQDTFIEENAEKHSVVDDDINDIIENNKAEKEWKLSTQEFYDSIYSFQNDDNEFDQSLM